MRDSDVRGSLMKSLLIYLADQGGVDIASYSPVVSDGSPVGYHVTLSVCLGGKLLADEGLSASM